ncbi:MAG: winged helix-turn-helix transcriptional regulator [Clostridiales bacterium]|nr:winged helix-turn-helix transcriptional regulator [Clostridiales bacterium]
MSELLDVLKSLSDETRLNIINLLLTRDYCVGALAKKMDITESAVSQHLKVLRMAGIVKGEKRGYFTHYFVDRELLKNIANRITELSNTEPIGKRCEKDHACCRRNK